MLRIPEIVLSYFTASTEDLQALRSGGILAVNLCSTQPSLVSVLVTHSGFAVS